MICLLFASNDIIPGEHIQTAYPMSNVDNRSRNDT